MRHTSQLSPERLPNHDALVPFPSIARHPLAQPVRAHQERIITFLRSARTPSPRTPHSPLPDARFRTNMPCHLSCEHARPPPSLNHPDPFNAHSSRLSSRHVYLICRAEISHKGSVAGPADRINYSAFGLANIIYSTRGVRSRLMSFQKPRTGLSAPQNGRRSGRRQTPPLSFQNRVALKLGGGLSAISLQGATDPQARTFAWPLLCEVRSDAAATGGRFYIPDAVQGTR